MERHEDKDYVAKEKHKRGQSKLGQEIELRGSLD